MVQFWCAVALLSGRHHAYPYKFMGDWASGLPISTAGSTSLALARGRLAPQEAASHLIVRAERIALTRESAI